MSNGFLILDKMVRSVAGTMVKPFWLIVENQDHLETAKNKLQIEDTSYFCNICTIINSFNLVNIPIFPAVKPLHTDTNIFELKSILIKYSGYNLVLG